MIKAFLTALALSSLVLLSAVTSFADAPYSKLTQVNRDGKISARVVYNFWSGEYPMPVIDLATEIGGNSAIMVEKSFNNLGQTALCTANNGIYHPWSKTANSVKNYLSIVPLQEYRLLKTMNFDATVYDEKTGDPTTVEIKARKSDLLTRVVYLSEGYCSGELVLAPKLKRAQVDFSCDQVEDVTLFKKTAQSQDDEFSEQWIEVNCLEGFTGYIRDQNLLTSPGAQEGRILGYGEVGPAE
ncbi:MAG: hypothetical protein AABZ31_14725 [Bdellovibrionota bacterium]